MLLQEKWAGYKIILASQSPRRQELLEGLGMQFTTEIIDVDEVFPDSLDKDEIPVFLAELKAQPFKKAIDEKTLVITADTIVWVDGEVMGKPLDYEHAFDMLMKLSGRVHKVITGVCLTTKEKQRSFFVETSVWFKPLASDEIDYYLKNYKPYDKAGAYGIQEWIGYVGISRIEGSYFNVVGMPVHRLCEELSKM
ncbi:MAG: Maf family nucleotide pyrophosphatase [Bacteroidota bacterium]|nr:Maf family nucleotide pyrophosphatase [Bacteroidota bacterium]